MLSTLLGGWKAWAAAGGVAIALLAALGVQTLRVSHHDTTIAEQGGRITALEGDAARAKADIQICSITNKGNLAVIDQVKASSAAALDAVTKDRDRAVAEAKSIKTVKETIHAEAPKCVGLPPAILAADDWLRAHPDDSGAGGH